MIRVGSLFDLDACRSQGDSQDQALRLVAERAARVPFTSTVASALSQRRRQICDCCGKTDCAFMAFAVSLSTELESSRTKILSHQYFKNCRGSYPLSPDRGHPPSLPPPEKQGAPCRRLGEVQVPGGLRLSFPLPDCPAAHSGPAGQRACATSAWKRLHPCTYQEQLFPGYTIQEKAVFSVTRNADINPGRRGL